MCASTGENMSVKLCACTKLYVSVIYVGNCIFTLKYMCKNMFESVYFLKLCEICVHMSETICVCVTPSRVRMRACLRT